MQGVSKSSIRGLKVPPFHPLPATSVLQAATFLTSSLPLAVYTQTAAGNSSLPWTGTLMGICRSNPCWAMSAGPHQPLAKGRAQRSASCLRGPGHPQNRVLMCGHTTRSQASLVRSLLQSTCVKQLRHQHIPTWHLRHSAVRTHCFWQRCICTLRIRSMAQ